MKPIEVKPHPAQVFLLADYLRCEAPPFEDCFRRLQDAANRNGWPKPDERTCIGWVNAIPWALSVFAREGAAALISSYPPPQQERSA